MLWLVGLTTAEQNIGKVVAKAVSDDRTVNKKLIIRGQARTQNELILAYEAATSKKLPRNTVTREQLEQHLKGGPSCIQSFLRLQMYQSSIPHVLK